MSKPTYTGQPIRIVNDNAISNYARLEINGTIVPFYEATIHLISGEFVTMNLKVRADQVDLRALQHHTRVEVVAPEKSDD